jgi:hypothetical protein
VRLADSREDGSDPELARFHLRDCVSHNGDELVEQIARAEAPFWQHVRDALWAHEKSLQEKGGLS